jgi:hypothetical protein
VHKLRSLLHILLILIASAGPAGAKGLHHYVFFNMDRERISDSAFIETKAFEGAQLKYTWKQLEPERDRYDFSIIRADLEYLTSKGKKLFIQLQDASFEVARINAPLYLQKDADCHGGVNLQYRDDGTPEGQVARRWDPAVRARFQKLLSALGKEFDGKIEGIALPETAVGIDEGAHSAPGFTFEAYRNGIIENMKALKKAFPQSVAIQYANFMPGEWLPDNDRSYLRSVYEAAKATHVGVGGPDLKPWKPGQMNNGYCFIRKIDGAVPVGIAVQEGNYEHINPKTSRRVTIAELIDFATDYLRTDYMFWCTQEPYYSGELIPFLRKRSLQK